MKSTVPKHASSLADQSIWRPARGGLDSDRIRFPGFPRAQTQSFEVQTGSAIWLELNVEDMISLRTGNGSVQICALNEKNEEAFADLGITDDTVRSKLDTNEFCSVEIEPRFRTRGIDMSALNFVSLKTTYAEALILRVREKLSFVAVVTASADDVVSGTACNGISIELVRHSPDNRPLPEPLGDIRDEFTIARGTASAYQIFKDEVIQVIDVEGRQCSDFMAMNSRALEAGNERFIDSTVTRSLLGGAYPTPGLFDKFFDQDMRPLLALEQDTVGRHDTFALACTARGYEERGFPGHLNCSDNISDAYEPYGIEKRRAWPAINFFFNSWIHPDDNKIQSDEAWSRPGDYVALRASTDLTCVSTACPDDVDPINGWNPTDIHVRIYKPKTSVKKAVAYRATAQANTAMTIESPFHERTSVLTRNFSVIRDYWMPHAFDATGAIEEYWASHNSVTVQDMSGLRKLDITGPDAERLLQLTTTKDVSKLAVNRGFYALLLDERGSVIDDGTLFRLAPQVFRWCCGSDDSKLHLANIAKQQNLNVWIKDLSKTLCNLAIQGPNSRELLKQIVFTRSAQPAFENIKWFGFAIGRLHDREGVPFMISRSGFTGQLGYEIFCDQHDALTVWDAIASADGEYGLLPQGSQALEVLRVEAGLMSAGAEFHSGVDADESGLGFAVNMRKQSFIGKNAIERNRQAPRKRLVGLKFTGNEVPVSGDGVFVDRRQVGHITSAVYSPKLECVIAMACVAVENTDPGNALEIGKLDGHMKRLPCEVTGIPFIDPKRSKPRA